MRTFIDAWAERPDPVIRLIDSDTGKELMRWGPERVRAMLEQGALWLPDLIFNTHGI
jgi:hypothetical protein